MAFNPCSITDALANFQYDLIRKLNKKFESLRRLARLLEQLADLDSLIPDLMALLPNLIPVIQIDLAAYNQLAAACPFLKLPSPGEGPIRELQNQVAAAYGALAGKILNGPHMRMAQLQDKMDSSISKAQAYITGPMNEGMGYLECLQAMCNAGSAVGSTLSNASQLSIKAETSKFATNFVEQGGKVLTAPMQQKYQNAQDVYSGLKALGADTTSDYRSVKAKTPSALVTRPTVDNGSTWSNPPYVPAPQNT